MIANVQDLYQHEPHLASRILGYWSNAFSAAVSIFLSHCLAAFLSRLTHTSATPSSGVGMLTLRRIVYYAVNKLANYLAFISIVGGFVSAGV